MSQGDYIKYKRVANELLEQSKMNPILESRKYIDYKEFTIENTVYNNAINYEKLGQSNMAVVFGIRQYNALTCPGFILCKNTNTRPNRKLLLGTQSAAQPLPIILTHVTPNKLSLCSYCKKSI